MKKWFALLCACVVLMGTAACAEAWDCPYCKAEDETTKFCTQCGKRRPLMCSQCGWDAMDKVDAKYCGDCGALLLEEEAESIAYAVGDTLLFGHYDQDGNVANGAEEIEWIVIGVEDDQLLLMSRYALTHLRYDTTMKKGITWETSTIRKWMNDTFLRAAFTPEEIEKVVLAQIETTQFRQIAKIQTEDRVFLLSSQEVMSLLEERLWYAEPAPVHERLLDNPCFWWVRDGKTVNGVGSIAGFGSNDEVEWYNRRGYAECAVRPCIYLKRE